MSRVTSPYLYHTFLFIYIYIYISVIHYLNYTSVLLSTLFKTHFCSSSSSILSLLYNFSLLFCSITSNHRARNPTDTYLPEDRNGPTYIYPTTDVFLTLRKGRSFHGVGKINDIFHTCTNSNSRHPAFPFNAFHHIDMVTNNPAALHGSIFITASKGKKREVPTAAAPTNAHSGHFSSKSAQTPNRTRRGRLV